MIRNSRDVYDEVVHFVNLVFDEALLTRCASEHERLRNKKILNETRTTFEAATLNAVKNLSQKPSEQEMRTFILSLSPALQLFLYERFYYFEQTLRELGNREADFPETFGSLLHQGLTRGFDLRRNLGLFV